MKQLRSLLDLANAIEAARTPAELAAILNHAPNVACDFPAEDGGECCLPVERHTDDSPLYHGAFEGDLPVIAHYCKKHSSLDTPLTDIYGLTWYRDDNGHVMARWDREV